MLLLVVPRLTASAQKGSTCDVEVFNCIFLQRCIVAGILMLLPWEGMQVQAETPEKGAHLKESASLPAGLPTHVDGWIARFHHAAKSRSHAGTMMVSSSAGAMSSARITHACSGSKQIERIESLTGVPRITFRCGHEVHTFLPQSRTVRRGHFDPVGGFHSLAQVHGAAVADFY